MISVYKVETNAEFNTLSTGVGFQDGSGTKNRTWSCILALKSYGSLSNSAVPLTNLQEWCKSSNSYGSRSTVEIEQKELPSSVLFTSFRLLFNNNQSPTDLSIIKDINGQCSITLSYGWQSCFDKKKSFLIYCYTHTV